MDSPSALPFASSVGGEQEGVAALWQENGVLLANSDEFEKTLTLPGKLSATELFSGQAIPTATENGRTALTLPPYGVVLAVTEA